MAKAKKRDPEYRLSIRRHLNERRQVQTTMITIETTKSFASFQYELAVKEETKGRDLRFKILGLKAPQLSLPATGPAQFVREYDNLKGKYTMTVESLDGTEHTANISVTRGRISILKLPKKSFIEFVAA